MSPNLPQLNYWIVKMFTKEKTEQNNALISSIIPEPQASLNPVSLTRKETEQSETTAILAEQVSLDDQNDNTELADAVRINSPVAEDSTEAGEYTSVPYYRNNEWKGVVSLYPKAYSQKPDNSEGGKISLGICQRENRKIVTATELKDLILKGHPVAPASFGKNEDGKDSRVARDAEALNFFLLDFDNKCGGGKDAPALYVEEGVYLERILERFNLVGITPNIIHESASSKEGHRKYHVVIFPKTPYEDLEKASKLLKSLKKVFGSLIDSSGLDIVHFFYGADPNKSDSLVSFEPNARMSTRQENQIFDVARQTEEAQRIHDAEILEAENKRNKSYKMDVTEAEEESLDNMQGELQTLYNSSDIQLKKIKTCLKLLPESFVHSSEEWFTVTQALKFEAETRPEISQEIEGLWDTWSKTSGSYNRQQNFARWNSLTRTDSSAITLGSIIKNYLGGWSRVRESLHDFYPEIKQQAAEIYSRYDAVSNKKKLELDKQKQNLTNAFNADDSAQYMDKMPMRQRVSHYIENYMAQDLRYNLHLREFEYKGKILDIHDFHLHLVVIFNKEVSEAIFRKAYEKYATKYAYHPFQEYIENLLDKEHQPSKAEYENAIEYLNKVATDYLRVQNDFEHLLFRKWLLGVVCRVLEPGYKFDGVLMLKGGQGLGKTTFFEAVAGLEYYRSHLGSIDRDSLAKMHRAIIIELAEISATFGKVKNEALKNFITERIDTFRRPYGYTDLDHPRRFVFGGSTNDDEFLTDPTGSRRYWVLEINQMIDTKAIAQHRDEIFRAAYILKLYGEQPYLNPEESTINENRNKAHKKVTLLDEAISEIVVQRMNNQEKVKGTLVEKIRFQIPFLSNDLVNDLRQDYPTLKPTPHGIKAALQSMGFEQVQKRVNGKAGRWWEPTDKYYELCQEAEAS